MFQVVKLSFEVAFLNSATKCPINAKMTQNDTKVKIKKSMKSHWFDMDACRFLFLVKGEVNYGIKHHM